jgi:serine/threonine protein kinase
VSKEIELGRLVGQGGFCNVKAVTRIRVNELYDISDESANIRSSFAKVFNSDQSMSIVLKTLRTDLPEEEHAKGVVDLAVEVDFLRVLRHEHIVTIRAFSNSDPTADRYFVILDLLTQTLEKRFNLWRATVVENSGYWFAFCGYFCAKVPILHAIWKERFEASLAIARALQYLHNSGIIYRDLKPDNIGFDASGKLKLFDFGLAKRLAKVEVTQNHENDGGLYLLTGNTGSLRYMAPEVALDQPYNTTVDTYSFGVLFWQICSLTTPFAGYSMKQHAEKVVNRGERPVLHPSWPLTWTTLMTQCWNQVITSRPDMNYVVMMLEQRLLELMEDDNTIPSRATERIRAVRKFKVKGTADDGTTGHTELDVDTRIISADAGNVSSFDRTSKIHDADIV